MCLTNLVLKPHVHDTWTCSKHTMTHASDIVKVNCFKDGWGNNQVTKWIQKKFGWWLLWLSQAPEAMRKALKGRIQNTKLSNKSSSHIHYENPIHPPPPCFFIVPSLRIAIIFWTRKLFKSQVPLCRHSPSWSVGGAHPNCYMAEQTPYYYYYY